MPKFTAMVRPSQQKKDGTYNVKIRMSHNAGTAFISTMWFVNPKELTKDFKKIKNRAVLDCVEDIIHNYKVICVNLGGRINNYTAIELARYLQDYDNQQQLIAQAQQERDSIDFFEFANNVINKLIKEEREGNAKVYKVAVNSLHNFVKCDILPFKDITGKLIRNWIDYLNNPKPNERRRRGGRAISLYIATIKAIYNRAKKELNDEDMGIIKVPNSPFAKIDMPKLPRTRKRALSVEQIRQIAALPYSTSNKGRTNRFNLAKDIFLLSFCLIGMNAVDLFTCTDLEDGRITYQRTKTKRRRDDNAEISIKIEDEIKYLMQKYKDKRNKRIFNFYQYYTDVNTFSYALNAGLKQIGKLINEDDLEFYSARHSWATIALNDVEIDKYTVHSALNHADPAMKVTDMYIKKSYNGIDKANRLVLDYMNLGIIGKDSNDNE